MGRLGALSGSPERTPRGPQEGTMITEASWGPLGAILSFSRGSSWGPNGRADGGTYDSHWAFAHLGAS
eukprot:2579676-Pyramimonas_sp.AAC.1